ncbi:tenascin [Apostichopus japonicus]|uniref:Tenascin n=1 Tax=Stichopus japonicus TaxID=307972 RepID=A0A2G8LNF2_STIJA|nr:tenascin [Apostichopus japonicus]
MEYDSVIVMRDMKVTVKLVYVCIQTVRISTTLVIQKMAFTQSFHLHGPVQRSVSTVKWIMVEDGLGGSTSFYRNWAAYKNGFGDINVDFWLGNEKLYYLTNQKYYSLRFDVTTSNRDSKYALYSEFRIMSESHNYRLDRLGSHSGTTGTRTLDNNKGKDFSTYDRDNDGCDKYNCAFRHRGGWWHSDSWCNYCHSGGNHCDQFHYTGVSSCYTICTSENLNGYYNGAHGQNIFSDHDAYCDITFTEMKIRPT